MNKKRILLLVPPGQRQYIRDYYCSFSSKADYYWPPQDLVVLSGSLNKTFEVEAIDAISSRMNWQDCLRTVARSSADMIIAATGSATLKEDLSFLKLVKENDPSTKIIVSSSIFLSTGEETMKTFSFLDGVLLDFTNDDAANYLVGKFDDIRNMFYRVGHQILRKCSEPSQLFNITMPCHDLFLGRGYRMPLFGNERFVSTITSIGCPYQCSFCCAGTVKHRARILENVIQEMKYVGNDLGVKNIFFANPIFFTNKEYAEQLLGLIIENKLSGMQWIANVRVDLLDEELIRLMKRAGCKALCFGIESGDQGILDQYNKGISLSQSRMIFDQCERQKIITLAYFMLGFPEEDRTSVDKTLRYIKNISCDYISVSFAMPDIGSRFRNKMIEANACSSGIMDAWDSSVEPYIKNSALSQEELIKIRKKIYRGFYLRPHWIARHLFGLNFMDLLKGGASILGR
jgi:radical SAM superfamily enzyme YgiQ (UPF0313 family)